MNTVLAIDPGREKCGLAVIDENGILCKQVISTEVVKQEIEASISRYPVNAIVIGNGTGGKNLIRSLQKSIFSIPIIIVNEAFSSRKARERFFKENPPKGLRRLIPRGLLIPHSPIDDYVAVILAEEYLGTGC